MAKAKRPPTQKEIQERKERAKGRSKETLTILNISRQSISINCKHPEGSDFFIASQDVRIPPGQRATLPKSRLWTSQISRLKKRQLISVISDSVKVEEKKEEMLAKRKLKKSFGNNQENILVVTSDEDQVNEEDQGDGQDKTSDKQDN